MLAIETRAIAGVGVAISVTTIPAAAYFGIALGRGEAREATGALAVLSLNVLFLGSSARPHAVAAAATSIAARGALGRLAPVRRWLRGLFDEVALGEREQQRDRGQHEHDGD